MKYILEKDNLEIVGKQYLKDVGGYDGTNVDSCKDIATVFPNMVELTYSELKTLRDSSNLIPGQQYRITDYITTTTQENTKSAGHQFDIIVTADTVNVLNENARACKHEGDTYFETENLEAWELKYCLDNDTDRFAWADSSFPGEEFVAIYWNDSVEGDNYDSKIGGDKIYDWGIEYDSELEKDNIVIYKSDESLYLEEGSADYEDKYFYRGIVTVDGVEYDSWKKWETFFEDWCYIDDKGQQYALTKRIVFGDKVVWSNTSIIGNTIMCDSSNCVIKDEFDAGSDDSGYYALSEYIYPQSIMMNDPVNGESYEFLNKDMFGHYGYEVEPNGNHSLFLLGYSLEIDGDGEIISNDGLCEDSRYYYRGIITVDGQEYDCWQKWEADRGYILDDVNSYYYLTNRIVDGEIINTSKFGKGVIYKMIDEYGNDLPYDFKNIKFKRWLYADGGGIGGYDNIGGENICPHEELTAIYYPNDYQDSVVAKILCKVENGKKYIGTLGELVSTIPSGASELLTETFIMLISNDDNINLSSAHHLRHYKWGEVMNINLTDYELSQADDLYLALVFCNLDKVVEGARDEQDIDSRMNIILDQNFRTGYYDEAREIDTMTARRIMIALHGSTDITGGLVMTNVLALKTDEENGDVESYCYTFSWEESNGDIIDASIFGNNGHLLNDEGQISGVFGNIMCVYMDYGDFVENPKSTKQLLNNNVFFSTYGYGGFYYGCYSNTFGNNCYSNTFGNSCNYNKFGNSCYNNTFVDTCYSNTFGNYCYYNTFGNSCNYNKFGDTCYSNTFGNDCGGNTFGDICDHNTFGNSCNSNTFGNSCYYNKFGNDCGGNTFGNYCYYNTFGNCCYDNTFGNYCFNNTFGSSKTSPSSYYRYIIFDNGNSYINLYCTSTTSSSQYYQNVRIGLGVNNSTTYKTISDSNVKQTYETLYIPNDSKTIKI